MITKKQLAIQLSKLVVFDKPKINLEQYSTPSEIAATILWDAYMKGDIKEKIIADLGAGTGILGIGALLLGAKKLYFIEKDEDAVSLLQNNLRMNCRTFNAFVSLSSVSDFNKNVDTIFQNPPFGTKEKHADKPFLEKAFSHSRVVYSFHKKSTDKFVRSIAADFGFQIAEVYDFNFPLRRTATFHKKKIERIEVRCYRMIKKSTK